jgi:hypothetical protein
MLDPVRDSALASLETESKSASLEPYAATIPFQAEC